MPQRARSMAVNPNPQGGGAHVLSSGSVRCLANAAWDRTETALTERLLTENPLK